MRAGKSIVELAKEVTRQQESKRDYVVDTRRVLMNDDASFEFPTSSGIQSHYGTQHMHGQVAEKVGIPRTYYETMREAAPGLLATNVNHWFAHNPAKRLIRTLDGNARAFLSDRYRPMDNFDMMEAVMPEIMETGMQVISSEVTETRLYLKVLNPKLEKEVKKGDVVQAGICLSNSEVGGGALRIEPLVYRLVCLNGAISPDHSMKKFHLGSAHEEGVWDHLSDRTRAMSDAALWNQVRDLTRAALKLAVFDEIVEKMRRAAGVEIRSNDIPEVVEVVRKTYSLTKDEGRGILQRLIEDGDLTMWGLGNAVTRHSQDVESYDRSTALEQVGGQIFELPPALVKAVAA